MRGLLSQASNAENLNML